MQTIPAQEIKRRGISAVDDMLDEGPVHVIAHNTPRYVVMDEARYRELIEAYNEAYIARVRAAQAEIAAEKGKRYMSVTDLMADIEAEEE